MTNLVHIGKCALRSNVLVAPMSGVTDLPFRRVLAQFEPGLVVSEMVASERLVAGDAENLAKASGKGIVDPLSVQLVGRDPHWMAEGAKACADAGADIIDINMGCIGVRGDWRHGWAVFDRASVGYIGHSQSCRWR